MQLGDEIHVVAPAKRRPTRFVARNARRRPQGPQRLLHIARWLPILFTIRMSVLLPNLDLNLGLVLGLIVTLRRGRDRQRFKIRLHDRHGPQARRKREIREPRHLRQIGRRQIARSYGISRDQPIPFRRRTQKSGIVFIGLVLLNRQVGRQAKRRLDRGGGCGGLELTMLDGISCRSLHVSKAPIQTDHAFLPNVSFSCASNGLSKTDDVYDEWTSSGITMTGGAVDSLPS